MNPKPFLELGASQTPLAKCLLYSLLGFFHDWVYFHSVEMSGKLLVMLQCQVPALAEVS